MATIIQLLSVVFCRNTIEKLSSGLEENFPPHFLETSFFMQKKHERKFACFNKFMAQFHKFGKKGKVQKSMTVKSFAFLPPKVLFANKLCEFTILPPA